MKKLLFLLLAIFTISSCSLFEKPSMTQEQIDELITQKANVEEELANTKQELDLLRIKAEECAQLLEEQTKEVKLTGKYFVIAGSFKNSSYAENYSEKIKKLGGAGNIIQGPYNFNLVVYSAHPTLAEAANSMYVARTNISEEAWIYMEK
jgi:cell division protein FtsN